MVQTIITLDEHKDRVLNIVKGKFGLRNKSEAIGLIIKEYEENMLEPELRPEYREELKKIDKGKFHKFSSVEELRKEIENV